MHRTIFSVVSLRQQKALHFYHQISKYVKVVNLMKQQENVLGLTRFGSLHYEKLHGDKEGLSSVRVNDQYRIEFKESLEEGKQISTICNITELSNHYK